MTGICLHKTILNFHLPVTEGSVIGLVLSFSLEELKFKSFTNYRPLFPCSPSSQLSNRGPVWDLLWAMC